MKIEDIKNTEFYKSLSNLSNSERGRLFEKYSAVVEDELEVKLIKHSYNQLGKINTSNPIISYKESWGNFHGIVIGLMEFVPNK